MIEDMTIRQIRSKTQHDYVRVVADFARFLSRSPDQAEPEDLRRYQLYLAAEGGRRNAIDATRRRARAAEWASSERVRSRTIAHFWRCSLNVAIQTPS